MSRHNASPAPEDAPSIPEQPTIPWLNAAASGSSNSAKVYHATAEWGKRGMTLQELTRAFDAFNEAEERVALGFAGSEDCNRKLAEPLSQVKTVFMDLDGLKPQSEYRSLFPTSSVAPQRNNVSHISQVIPDANSREINAHAYVMRTDAVPSYSNPSHALEHYPDIKFDRRVDEDTIKPSQKRRQSLLTTSLGTPSQYTLTFEDEPETDIPLRPPSRLGFVDDGNMDEYGSEDGGNTL